MPIITVKMLAGRTDDQKRAMVKEVTEAVSRTVGAPPENISIIIEEMTHNHYAKSGILHQDQ
jgi:4-oxalocrotonate tautomerase